MLQDTGHASAIGSTLNGVSTETHPNGPGFSPFVTILFIPRPTIRFLLDHRRDRGVVPLILMAMISVSLRPPEWTGMEQAAEILGTELLIGVVVLALILMVGVTVGGFYLFAWLAALAGRFFDGSASAREVRTALAWGSVPLIWALVYRIPAMLFWGPAYASIHSDGNGNAIRIGSESVVYNSGAISDAPISQILILFALDLIVIGWTVVVMSRTLAEAQQFSSWKGLANLLLAFVLPIVAIAIIVTAAVMTAKTG